MVDITTDKFDADKAVGDYLTTPKEVRPPASAMRITLPAAMDKNPDETAELKAISKRTGVPLQSLQNPENRKKVEKQHTLDTFNFDSFATSFPNSARLMADPDMAAIAYDDVEVLGSVEKTVDFLGDSGKAIGSGLFWEGVGHRMWGALGWSSQAVSEYATGPFNELMRNIGSQGDLDPFDDLAEFSLRQSRTSGEINQEVMTDVTEGRGRIGRGFMSGMNSVGVTGPSMVAAAVTRNPNLALGYIGATSFGGAAERGLDEGLDTMAAGLYAFRDAGIEVGTERIPLGKFIGDLNAGSSILRTITTNIATEVPTELLATTLQNFNDWATLNPDEPFQTYLDQLPDDLVDTVIATVSAAGVQTGAITLTTRALEKGHQKLLQADGAMRNAQTLEKLHELAAASETLRRDTDSFERWVESMSEDKDFTDVYLDTEELAQSGVDLEALAEISPSVAKQLDTAVATGSLLRIPLSEYAASVAPSEVGQSLLDFAKTEPQGMNRREAEEFMQNGMEELQQEVERELEKSEEKREKSASRVAVEKNILTQLGRANRFTEDVNKPYAALHGYFYETMGQRVGKTAEEMFEQYPLKIQAESVAPENMTLDQEGYRGHHTAPSRDGANTLDDATDVFGDDIYNSAVSWRYFGHGGDSTTLDKQSAEIIAGFQNKPDADVTIYRAVPKGVKDINPGDWVTINKAYAREHGERHVVDDATTDFEIVEKTVKASEITTDGNSIHEWGYAPEGGAQETGEFFQSVERAQKNNIGLYSKVEQEVLEMNLPNWKPNKKKALSEEEKAEKERLQEARRAHQEFIDTQPADAPFPEGMTAALNPVRLNELLKKEREAEGAASGKEIWQKLSSLPVKQEELEWLGVEEFLKAGDKFTRQEVVDFIRGNGVEVAETVADRTGMDTEGEVDFHNGTPWTDREVWGPLHEDAMSEYDEGEDRYNLEPEALRQLAIEESDYISKNFEGNIDEDTDALDEWLRENFSDELRDKVEELAEEAVQEEYMNDPVMMYQADVDDATLVIFGNDDIGYDIRQTSAGWDVRDDGAPPMTDIVVEGGDIFSVSEAEIRAQEYAVEHGLIASEQDETVAKWEDYVTEGDYTNYREVKLTLPEIEGDFFNDVHFPDRNVVAFLRVEDRNLTSDSYISSLVEKQPDAIPDDFSWQGSYPYARLKGEIENLKKRRAEAQDTDALKDDAENAVAASYKLAGKDIVWDAIQNVDMIGASNGLVDLIDENLPYREYPQDYDRELYAEIREYNERRDGLMQRARDYKKGNTSTSILDTQIRNYEETLESLETAWRAESGTGKRAYVTEKTKSKTYFVDEFQSDWHQDGRQKGYQTGKVDAGELDAQSVERRHEARRLALDVFANDPELANRMSLVMEESINPNTLEDAKEVAGDAYDEFTIKAAIAFGQLSTKENKGVELIDEQRTFFDEALTAHPELSRVGALLAEANELVQQARNERYGVPDAPFKGDNWIALGLKRALVQAAENDYELFAWPDAEVLMGRWSDRYEQLYRVQYDTKMPSIMKKLTKAKPIHIEANDNPDGFGYWAVQLTPELKEKILNEGFALFQKQRGSFNPQTSTISLLQAADLSTFLHESGHFFLETLGKMASDPSAPAQIKEDMDAALKWMKIPNLEDWQSRSLEEQREAHEQFARGFEAYLFEGKAPNIEMQNIFQRFRDWLVNIYRELRNLNVELDDEIRGVFDRMLATDEVIRETEEIRGMAPLFESAEEAGMTQDEWEQYQRLGAEATAQAKENLDARSLRDMKWLSNAKSKEIKRLQKDARQKRQNVKAEVEYEVMSEPVNQAYRFITKGEYVVPDNANKRKRRLAIEVAEGEQPTKMSLESLREAYGEADQIWQGLPTGRYGLVAKDGMDFNVIAELFGYASGDQMLQQLLTREDPKAKIEALTDQRMLERYGDISDPQSLERAADAAVHNDARTRFVASEMTALQKAIGGRKILTQAAKQLADQMIARLRIRDLKPSRYTAAEAKAGRAADKARREGDLQTAAAQKRNQLVQLYAAKAAIQAREQNEKDLRYLKKFDREGSRKNIDVEYLDQIDAILSRFDLKKSTSLKAIDKRKSFATWLAEQQDMGFEPDVPEELLNSSYTKHYKDMTVEETRGLVDTIKQIEHLGRLKKKLLTLKDKRELNQVIEELEASIYANSRGRTVDNTVRATKGYRAKALFKGFLAQHRKIASLSRQADGVQDGGPMWEVLIRTMNEAGDKEAVMREEAAVKLAKIAAEVQTLGKMGGKGTYFPTLQRSFNREERLAVVLNMGNEGNMQRLLDGKGWTREQIQPIVDSLSAEEVNFVKEVWELFESYRPQIAAKERRIYGKEPDWVEPTPLQTPHGELAGGYYPIKYDTRQNSEAQQHDAAEQAKQQLRGAYTSATTRRSFTKPRADEVHDRPLLLTTDAMYSGLNEVIHDLSWHEWLIDANRLLRSKRLTNAILETQGAEVLDQYKEAVKDIAAGEMAWTGSFEKVSAHLRQGATIAGLGLSISTGLINLTGFSQSVVRVGPRWAMQGLAEWTRDPVNITRQIQEKSDFMRLRAKTMMREINEVQSMLRDRPKWREIVDNAVFVPITVTQMVVDTPTWWGAYQKALADGQTEERAIALADQAVIDAQAGGQLKDLSEIQRSKVGKLFTVFYSYFSTMYQLTVEQTSKTNFKDPMDVLRLGTDYFLLYALPAALGSVIRSAISGDDDWYEPEKLAKAYANEQLAFLMSPLVGLRELTPAVQKLAGTTEYNFAYSGPAALRFYNAGDRFAEQAGQGEIDGALRRATVNVAGVALRLPSTQTNRTIDGMLAVIEGETYNPAALIFGPPK